MTDATKFPGQVEPETIYPNGKGGRNITLTPDASINGGVHLLIDEPFTKQYLGIVVNRNQLIAALHKIGALDDLLRLIREDATAIAAKTTAVVAQHQHTVACKCGNPHPTGVRGA